ncbi:MAG TPA: sensor histidine kinase N-terminal domain-containing protein [Rhodocyclaceae bacterium]
MSSLRRSLLQWLLWPLVPILLCGAFFAFQQAWRASQDTFDLTLLDSALDLARVVGVEKGKPVLDLPLVARQMLVTHGVEDRIVFAVRSSNGALVAGERDLPIQTEPSGGIRQQYYDVRVEGAPARAIGLRADLKGGLGYVDIAVAQTLKARDRIFYNILVGLLIPEVLLVVASLAVVWFGVQRGLAPAERLRSEIVSRSPQDLHPIEESPAPAELRPIVHAINGLLARLDAALGSQRQFIANAAHQLRTPLAVLRARIELAQGKHGAVPPEVLDELLGATERTTRLANQLLSLARAEHIHTTGETGEMVDLKQLLTELAGDWVMRAAQRDIEPVFELEPVAVRGNAFLIREMLANVLDNAIRYTPAGGMVTVRVKSGGVIEVEDNGPGIPAEARDKVRERFYRLPGAAAGGCGLGLAIVDEIAAAHGAALTFSDPPQGHGLVVAVRFPAPAPAAS